MIPKDHPLAERVLNLSPINGLAPRLQSEVLAQGELLEAKRKRVVFEEWMERPMHRRLIENTARLLSPLL